MPKLYIMTDYEGVSGIDEWDDRSSTDAVACAKRLRHRRLCTGEINAAVDGALDAGFDHVLVNDAHGGGRMLLVEDIHPRCLLFRGAKRPTWLAELDGSYDAAVFIGAHAMADTPRATLSHTFSKGVKEWQWCGSSIGEIGATVLGAAAMGVPTVCVSGGELACREAEELVPGIVTAPVKKDVSELSAVHMPPPAARELIRERVAEGLSKLGEIEPLGFGEPPYTFRIELREPAFSASAGREGMRVIDGCTVEYSGDEPLAVMKDAIY